MHTSFDPVEAHVEVGSSDIFNYPFMHMTGHGRWALSDAEAQNLRKYLEGGGFLHIDDNYGLNSYVRPALKKVFPELELVELPFSYPIYHQKYNFPNGLPRYMNMMVGPLRDMGLFIRDGWFVFIVLIRILVMGGKILTYTVIPRKNIRLLYKWELTSFSIYL